MIFCIKCHQEMEPIMFDFRISRWYTQGFICKSCNNIYDLRQIGPSNRELERDQKLCPLWRD